MGDPASNLMRQMKIGPLKCAFVCNKQCGWNKEKPPSQRIKERNNNLRVCRTAFALSAKFYDLQPIFWNYEDKIAVHLYIYYMYVYLFG